MSWLYPDRGDFIAVVGRMQDINAVRQVKAALLSSQDLSVYSMNTPGFIPGIDFSDHLNYWQHDIPAIMITDTVNRPGFPGECFICELRLPDHRFRWKHNKLFLLLPEEYGPAFPAIVDCYTSPPT
ncbi:peptidase [Escherichia coli O145:H28]|nr:peptidase [Escherichia coli O145:H28]